MSINLNFGRDQSGSCTYAPDFPTNIFSATLTNGSAQSITVPKNAAVWYVSFSIQPGCNVWVCRNGTAAVPAGASFAATTSELNPGQRRVYSGDTLSLITDNATADVEVSFYVNSLA